MFNNNFLRLALIATIATSTTTLSGCVAISLATLAGTASVIADRSSVGNQLSDENIQIRAKSRLSKELGDNATLSVRSYNQRVLITGEIPDISMKNRIVEIVSLVPDVREIIDQTVVASPTNFRDTVDDAWISSKVRAALIAQQGVPSYSIDVTTARGKVYLLGLVTRQEGEMAAIAAARITGVVEVIKAFEYISDNQTQSLTPNNPTPKSVQVINNAQAPTVEAVEASNYEPKSTIRVHTVDL